MSSKSVGETKPDTNVAVAIDRDKGSQFALKWAVDQLLSRGQTLTLLHVKPKSSSSSFSVSSQSSSDPNDDRSYAKQVDGSTRELFLPYRCFCTRNEIKVNEVVVEDGDIAKAIIEYVNVNTIDTLILGAPSRSGIVRKYKITDIPSTVLKSAPDFCTVCVIAKGKILSVRTANCNPSPKLSPPASQNNAMMQQNRNAATDPIESYFSKRSQPYRSVPMQRIQAEIEIKSPFNRGKLYEPDPPDNDISYVSNGRPSVDRMFPADYYDALTNTDRLLNLSHIDFKNFGSVFSGNRSMDFNSLQDYTSSPMDSGKPIWSSQNTEDVEFELRRLRLELMQKMDMYSAACKEALTAKQKAMELHCWKLEYAKLAEEAALALIEKDKAKSKAAIEASQQAQRLVELESQKRINAEMKAIRDAEERDKEDVESEMSRLRLELKQTMDMYSSACKEALTAKQKAWELHRWKLEEQQKLEDAKLAEEATLALVEKEKAKSKAAIEATQVAQRLTELESQKRIIYYVPEENHTLLPS